MMALTAAQNSVLPPFLMLRQVFIGASATYHGAKEEGVCNILPTPHGAGGCFWLVWALIGWAGCKGLASGLFCSSLNV
jgi:hypothetical protein